MQRFKDKENPVGGTVKSEHFLQSKEWEGFQKSLGREAFRVDGALFVKLPLAFGKSYLYAAGFDLGGDYSSDDSRPPAAASEARAGQEYANPALKSAEKQSSPRSIRIFEVLRKAIQSEGVVFLKLELMVKDEPIVQDLARAGFKKSAKHVQPQRTIILDIAKSEEELLTEMHQKTRYNIRLAEKHDAKVSSIKYPSYAEASAGRQVSSIEKFWELIQKTSQRDKFFSHSKEYYEKLLELPFIKLFIAEHQDKIIAANIVLFHNDTVYYLHGASDYEYRNLMAPYLLHWETIKYAQERGYKNYDFWGIDEKKWPGVTYFKRGFGGQEVEYIGSYDYVFQPVWYKFYKCGLFLRSRRMLFLPRRR